MFLTPNHVSDSKEAIVSDAGVRITYGDLREDCRRLDESLEKRCFLIIFTDNSQETIRFYYAAMAGKRVPLLLDANSHPEYHAHYISLYRPRYLWAPISQEPLLAGYGRIRFRSEAHILIETDAEIYPMNPELALLLTTSGSTGNPKTVRLSYRNLQENIQAVIETLKITSDARGVTSLPMNYTYGMAICHMHFAAGATLIVTGRKVLDRKFHDFIRRERITNMQGVPYIHEMLDRMGFYDDLPEQIDLITMGGGKARDELQEKLNRIFAQRGIRFCALYGQTEGTTMLTRIPDGKIMNDPGCIGVACRGMRAEIDPESRELCFYGSSVCLGYAEGATDLDRGDDNRGFLRTGDIARMDELGQIYLEGRVKRFLKMAGTRVNMDDIETAVMQHFPGTECACCGNDNDLHIFVTGDAVPAQVRKMLASRLNISHLMIRVFCVPAIIRNPNGKIDYLKMEQQL